MNEAGLLEKKVHKRDVFYRERDSHLPGGRISTAWMGGGPTCEVVLQRSQVLLGLRRVETHLLELAQNPIESFRRGR